MTKTRIIQGSELADKELEVLDNGLLKIVDRFKPKKFEPVMGGNYYYIDSTGDIRRDVWDNYTVDRYRNEHSILFDGMKRCEFYQSYLRRRDELSRPFETGKNNYCFITYEDGEVSLSIDDYVNLQYPGTTYFNSEKDAQKLIDEFGEDFIKAWEFGIYA